MTPPTYYELGDADGFPLAILEVRGSGNLKEHLRSMMSFDNLVFLEHRPFPTFSIRCSHSFNERTARNTCSQAFSCDTTPKWLTEVSLVHVGDCANLFRMRQRFFAKAWETRSQAIRLTAALACRASSRNVRKAGSS